ncbi:MAG: hypothetical protein JWP16_1405 [Alphaproteobacteria bacterium]|nr:hypothetical protein [Alphaproteobacteria bacterium]
MRLGSIAGALALAGVAVTPAFAQDCGPLKQVNTVSLQMAAGGLRTLIHVTINGTDEPFLLDTGGTVTQIGASVAQDLKLPAYETTGKILDLYGHASNSAVRVASFGLGRLKDTKTTLFVSPNPDLGKGPYAGLFATDYMGKYDTELDFGGGKLNYFFSDHCPGHVIYWPAAAAAIVPMTFRDQTMRIPVTLNGHTFTAIIDTGAPYSTITASAARRVFGMDGAGTDDEVIHDYDGKKEFMHIFDSLGFEGVAVQHPHVIVIPDMVGSKDAGNGMVTGSRTRRVDDLDGQPEMLIGMSVLNKLRLYIAFDERKIYVTPATTLVQ